MSNKYQIEIGVKNARGSVAAYKRQAAQAGKAMQQARKESGGLRSTKGIDALNKSIEKLIKSNKELIQAIKGQGGGGSGGRGPRSGGTISKRVGLGNLGRVGTALGLIGTPVALGTFAVSQILKWGKQYIERASQQLGTSGVGGYHRAGAFDYFTAGDMGSLYKSHKMASGKDVKLDPFYRNAGYRKIYGAGSKKKQEDYAAYYQKYGQWKHRELTNALDTAEDSGDPAKIKQARQRFDRFIAHHNRMQSSRRVFTEPSYVSFAKKFGWGSGQLGETMGTLDRATNGNAGRAFRTILGAGHAGGIQTEMPKLVEAISQALKDSVKEGIQASHLAKDIAIETSALMKQSPTKSVEQALNAINRLQQIQKGVGEGNIGSSFERFAMFKIARERVKTILAGKGTRDEQNWLKQMKKERNISPEQLKSGTVDPHTLVALSQEYSLGNFSKQRELFVKNIMDTFGGQGKSFAERKNQAWRYYQHIGGSMNRKQFSLYTNSLADGHTGTLGNIEKNADTVTRKYRKDMQNDSTQAQGLYIKQETLALGWAAKQAAQGVYALEKAVLTAASALQKFSQRFLTEFNKSKIRSPVEFIEFISRLTGG